MKDLSVSRLIRLPALLTFEVGAVVTLHLLGGQPFLRVDWSNSSEWLDSATLDYVIAASLRLAALVLAYWLLFSTLAYLLASLSRRPRAIRATSWMTLAPIRRLVSRSVALSIAASSVAVPLGPAVADLALGSRASTVVVQVDQDGVIRPPATEQPTDEEEVEPDVLVPPHLQNPANPVFDGEPVTSEDATAAQLDGTVTRVHKVVRGDHLWSIACQHLEAVSGRDDLGEHEIAPYWVRVIDANRSSIRSGDPDLIYPGEQIVLPPVSG